MSYFADGHRGAAIIATCTLASENGLAGDTQHAMARLIAHHWGRSGLCAGFPDEAPDEAFLDQIALALQGNISRLRQVGHNVIFAMLALKAFKAVPQAITPSRVEGVCRLIRSFATYDDVTLTEDDHYPDLADPATFAASVLEECLAAAERFRGTGNGYPGHLLTYGQALLELRSLGYPDLAEAGIHAYQLFVKVARQGPTPDARRIPDHADRGQDPLTHGYWEQRGQGDPRLGHCFKYPYSFHNLLARASDPQLTRRCMAIAHLLF